MSSFRVAILAVFLSLFSLLFSMKIQTLRRSDALGTPNLKRDVSNSHVEASELIGKLKRKIDSGKGSLKSVNEALWYANRLSDWRLALDLFSWLNLVQMRAKSGP